MIQFQIYSPQKFYPTDEELQEFRNCNLAEFGLTSNSTGYNDEVTVVVNNEETGEVTHVVNAACSEGRVFVLCNLEIYSCFDSHHFLKLQL